MKKRRKKKRKINKVKTKSNISHMQIQSEENYETIDCLFPKIYIFFFNSTY